MVHQEFQQVRSAVGGGRKIAGGDDAAVSEAHIKVENKDDKKVYKRKGVRGPIEQYKLVMSNVVPNLKSSFTSGVITLGYTSTMVAHFLPTLCDEKTTPAAAVTNMLPCLLFSVKNKETKDSFSTDVGVQTYVFRRRALCNIAGHAQADSLGMFRNACLLYTSPSPRDQRGSRMPSSA